MNRIYTWKLHRLHIPAGIHIDNLWPVNVPHIGIDETIWYGNEMCITNPITVDKLITLEAIDDIPYIRYSLIINDIVYPYRLIVLDKDTHQPIGTYLFQENIDTILAYITKHAKMWSISDTLVGLQILIESDAMTDKVNLKDYMFNPKSMLFKVTPVSDIADKVFDYWKEMSICYPIYFKHATVEDFDTSLDLRPLGKYTNMVITPVELRDMKSRRVVCIPHIENEDINITVPNILVNNKSIRWLLDQIRQGHVDSVGMYDIGDWSIDDVQAHDDRVSFITDDQPCMVDGLLFDLTSNHLGYY